MVIKYLPDTFFACFKMFGCITHKQMEIGQNKKIKKIHSCNSSTLVLRMCCKGGCFAATSTTERYTLDTVYIQLFV